MSAQLLGTQAGEPCPVCGLPDPAHDWDVHDAAAGGQLLGAGPVTAAAGILARSSTRGTHRVRVLAVHTTEGTGYTAAELRDALWWTGSSHAIADRRTLLTPAEGCVPYARASWTLRSGNPWSENIELCAMAGWTRDQWLERPDLLENCSRWLADRSRARGIPLVKITPAQYRAGASGVIGHHDHTVGYQDGTHWDPGPGFPWDVVLTRAQQIAGGQLEVQDMLQDERDALLATKAAVDWWVIPDDDPATPADERQPNSKGELGKRVRGTHVTVAAMHTMLAQLLAIATKGADVDEATLAAELAPAIAPAISAAVIAGLGDVTGLTPEQLVAAVERGVENVLGRAVAR